MDSIAGTKLVKLKQIIRGIGPAVVAFSGGVDSAFLIKVSADVLKRRMLAVTVDSVFLPGAEKKEALRIARALKVPHRLINIKLSAKVRSNTRNRCYHCKKAIFSRLKALADKEGLSAVIDGSNADDLCDLRPGNKALKELKIYSPLQESGFTKKDIRELSKRMSLNTWDKPALACLATRFPFGTKITGKKLKMVERAEAYLRGLGFLQLRARHHGDLCRIEIDKDSFGIFIKNKDKIVDKIKSLGFEYVVLDLEGYRMGSMNKAL